MISLIMYHVCAMRRGCGAHDRGMSAGAVALPPRRLRVTAGDGGVRAGITCLTERASMKGASMKGASMEVTVAEKIRSPAPASAPSTSPGLLDRTVWRDALLAWLGQRLLCVPLAYLGLWLLVRRPMGAPLPGLGD